ncbi:MAG: lipid-binding protein [Rikenellaceae bacterium]
MKKYIVLMAAALVGTFSSCSVYTDVEAGGTAVEKMAGTWTVVVEQSVAEYRSFDGSSNDPDPDLLNLTEEQLDALVWEDILGYGNQEVITSNTAANIATEMWFVDNFWGAAFKCDVNYNARTFSCAESEVYEGCNAYIKYGRITEDSVITPSGRTADGITAYVYYSDFGEYFGGYGLPFTMIKITGYRYTGYTEDL